MCSRPVDHEGCGVEADLVPPCLPRSASLPFERAANVRHRKRQVEPRLRAKPGTPAEKPHLRPVQCNVLHVVLGVRSCGVECRSATGCEIDPGCEGHRPREPRYYDAQQLRVIHAEGQIIAQPIGHLPPNWERSFESSEVFAETSNKHPPEKDPSFGRTGACSTRYPRGPARSCRLTA